LGKLVNSIIGIMLFIFFSSCVPVDKRADKQEEECADQNCQAGATTLTCQGKSPLNAKLCLNDELNLTFNLNKGLVNSCTSKKCEYICNKGYSPVNGVCLVTDKPTTQCNCGSKDSNNPCTGKSISINIQSDPINGVNSQNAIFEWRFHSGGKDAQCGQFANGDYWVAPAVGESDVTVVSITANGEVSADVDPVMDSMGLLSGEKNYGNYNSSENIIPKLPQKFSKVSSILAAIKRNETLTGKCGTKGILGECVDAYNVVTILNNIPPKAGDESIRPNITGETKVLLTFSDFDLSRLPAKNYLSGTDSNGLEAIRQRWSHSTEIFGLKAPATFSEGGRAFRSHILIDDYGGGMATTWNSDMVTLFSSENKLEEKKPALASMISFGLDLYHGMYDIPEGVTRHWGRGATQAPGKFLPAVFMAALKIEPTYSNRLKTVGPNLKKENYGPHELGQVIQGKDFPVWGDFIHSYSGGRYQGAYWGSLLKSQCFDGASGVCNTAIGKKTQLDPYGYIDGPPNKPGSNYMGLSLGIQRSMVGIMFMMPEILETVNYPPLIRYVDRLHQYGLKTANDPCVTPDSREDVQVCDTYRNTNCKYYGITWGPENIEDINSACIKVATPPFTKVGRFTELDGQAVKARYTSRQVEDNWVKIRE
jgi:hypothetical protein